MTTLHVVKNLTGPELNSITKLVIVGWIRPYSIHYMNRMTIELEVFQRYDDEKWTFDDIDKNGVLKVKSNMAKISGLLTELDPAGLPWPRMIINIHRNRRNLKRPTFMLHE